MKRRPIGLLCICFGAFLNYTAELVNGGWKMPVMGVPEANDAHHIAMIHPKFWFICDWIGGRTIRMSVGDIFLFTGILVLLYNVILILSRKSAE